MGVLLDSSVLIAAERHGQNSRQSLISIAEKLGDTDVAVFVVTLIELAHGAARADTLQRRETRQRFIDERLSAVPVYPITTSTALHCGQLGGQSQARGGRIPLADLMIGVTALELGYSVVTVNLRHFQLVPGLHVPAV